MPKHETESEILLHLLRASLQPNPAQAVQWDETCDPQALAGMIRRQSLVTMVYPVVCCQIDGRWSQVKQILKPVYDRDIHRAMIQEYEFQTLLEEMERDGIDCLPMKGWIMREYYPDPLMRSMGDLDVLIREMDSRKMQKWMEGHGYRTETIDPAMHDCYKKLPHLEVELHHCLVSKTYLEQQRSGWQEHWLTSLWQENDRLEGKKHVYRLSNEDFLVFHLLHFYKHFTRSGVGIRPLVDLFLFLQAKEKGLDWNYLYSQMDALHITGFCKQMKRLAFNCFMDQQINENDQVVVDYLVQSSIYGQLATAKTARMFWDQKKTVEQTRRHIFWSECFLCMDSMKKIYPRLNRMPWLLPFYWAVRIGRIVFFESYKLADEQKNMSQGRYDDMKEIYLAAGIFEEGPK